MRRAIPALVLVAIIVRASVPLGAEVSATDGPMEDLAVAVIRDVAPDGTVHVADAGGDPGRSFLPIAAAHGELDHDPLTTAVPSATAPATATPLPTPSPGTPTPATPTPTAGVAPPELLVAVGDVSAADVAGGGGDNPSCQHLVVWLDQGSASGAIWGRFVGPGPLGEAFLVSAEAGAAGAPSVAYNALRERWLVVWAAPKEQSVSAIRGRSIGCSAPEGAVIEIGRYWLVEDQPAVAADGDGYAVVWRRSFSGRPDLHLVGVRVDGPTVPEPQSLADPGPVSEPALDCSGTGSCLVAWTDGTDRLRQDVFARSWTPRSGTVDGGVLPIGDTNLPELAASVAWNATPDVSAYALTWSVESRYRAVYARSVHGGALGPAIEVMMGLGGSYTPDVSAVGSGFVAAYAMAPRIAEGSDISISTLSFSGDTGALSRTGYTGLSDSAVRSWAPAVAAAGDSDGIVVWQDEFAAQRRQIVARYIRLAPQAEP